MRLNWSICREKGKRMGNNITMNGLSHYHAATKTVWKFKSAVTKLSQNLASVVYVCSCWAGQLQALVAPEK